MSKIYDQYFDNNIEIKKQFWKAKQEIGDQEFEDRLRGVPDGSKDKHKLVLDYVDTLVFNMPGTCYANCSYCIDKYQKKCGRSEIDNGLQEASYIMSLFPYAKRICITGGSLEAGDFNKLIASIRYHYQDGVKPFISGNTNGFLVDYYYDTSWVDVINLHRQSPNEEENRDLFGFGKRPIGLFEAHRLGENKLFVSVTATEDFNIYDGLSLKYNLYIHRLMLPTFQSDRVFNNIVNLLDTPSKKKDTHRRNEYENIEHRGRIIRLSYGDEHQKRVPGRYPVFLNVCILHRNGKVCGSGYDDDKYLGG